MRLWLLAEAVIHSNVMIHPGIRPDPKIRDAALRAEKGTSGGEGEKKKLPAKVVGAKN